MADSLSIIIVGFIEDIAFIVDDLGNDCRLMMTTVIGNSGVSTYKFKKIDVARTESQCRLVLKRALYTHLLCHLYDIINAYFLTKACCYGVDTLCESAAERY